MKIQDIFNQCGSPEAFIEKVNETLKELCNEQPEFVYCTAESFGGQRVNCRYNGPPIVTFPWEKDRPNELGGPESKGCIFGQVFQRMGWDDVAEMNAGGGIGTLIACTINPKTTIRIPFSWKEIQGQQDAGLKWGDLPSLLV